MTEGVREGRYVLRLYVTGQTPRSEQAVANLREIISAELTDEFELDIIDVLKHPQLADEQRIVATPTLVRELPPPLRRIIGDLSDRAQVRFGLGLDGDLENGFDSD